MTTSRRNFSIALAATFIEHYNKALFPFLLPLLAPLFFPDLPPLSSLLWIFGVLPLGVFSRPLGALFFGALGDRGGRKRALFLALTGSSLCALGLGSLPLSVLSSSLTLTLLSLGKLGQSFFSPGISWGASLLMLEGKRREGRTLYSALYQAATVGGVLCASLLTAWLARGGQLALYWRALYLLGGGGGLLLLLAFPLLRETLPPSAAPKPFSPLLPLLTSSSLPFLVVTLTSAFSYANYYLLTSLCNALLPLCSSHSTTQVMESTHHLLLLDLLLLPLLGWALSAASKRRFLILITGVTSLLALPLYTLLPSLSLSGGWILRALFVILGASFSLLLTPFYQEYIPQRERFRVMGVGHALGSQLLGMSSCWVGVWLYRLTGRPGAPALYLVGLGVCTLLSLRALPRPFYGSSKAHE